ncbi:hypothetical protein EDD90_1886 [Streptomyces sp. Ag109_O5-1]|nr:hypothetical protein EDD90_1886 [Streptomyces sp. Ag109_O5-1]
MGTSGINGAGEAAASRAAAFREELADRLHQHLGRHGISEIERAAVVGGQIMDLLIPKDGENIALLIDTGPLPDRDPARELRLTHARGDLLHGLPSGGHGAKPGDLGRSVRVPAWRILAGEQLLAQTIP